MSNIQSVSIISAFPIGIIMIIMIWSFFKDAKNYLEELKTGKVITESEVETVQEEKTETVEVIEEAGVPVTDQ